MNFTTENLENMTFNNSLHGYSKSQVNDVILKVVDDYKKYMSEIDELKCRISVLSETVQHYKTIEESMQHCLIITQHTCDEMKMVASDKAENIISGAEYTAHKMVSDASQEAENIKQSYEEVKGKIFTFRTKTEALLTAQLDVLKQLSGS